eukprot:549714-Rhodomonas_salina.1
MRRSLAILCLIIQSTTCPGHEAAAKWGRRGKRERWGLVSQNKDRGVGREREHGRCVRHISAASQHHTFRTCPVYQQRTSSPDTWLRNLIFPLSSVRGSPDSFSLQQVRFCQYQHACTAHVAQEFCSGR